MAAADFTVRLYDLKKRRLLATLAAAAGDGKPAWVVLSPAGHADANAAGRRLLQFRVGKRAFPHTHAWKRVFRKDLLKRILSTR